MVAPLFFYELVLIALVWLFLLLYWLWPHDPVARRQAAHVPTPPRRLRSREPKPFAGLTHTPHCALCEHEAAHPQAPPPTPPDPMPPTHRRSRTVDTSRYFCPHAGCRYRGWLG